MDAITCDRNRVVDDYIALFNDPPGSRAQLAALVAEDVFFRDPFNELRGLDPVHALLVDFAARVRTPRFTILRRAWDGDTCLLRWDMSGQVALVGQWRVAGMTELEFDSGNRIRSHIDYWDAAGQLYEHLPLIGRVLKMIRKRASAG